MYKCPHCGGNMDFLPGTEVVKCEYCDSEFNPQEVIKFNKKLTAAEYTEKTEEPVKEEKPEGKADDSKTLETTVFTCPQCGGEIYSLDQSAVTFCSYCGSQVELKSRLERIRKPDYVLPFKITAEEGKQAYLKKVRGAIFAPSYIKKDSEVEKLRGIYMPYWSYDIEVPEETEVKSKNVHTSGSYRYTDHYKTTITAKGNIEGIAFDAASAFADELSEGIAPYDISEVKEFNPAYLASFYADESDVNSGLYEDEAIFTAADAFADNVYINDMSKYGLSRAGIAGEFRAGEVKSTLSYYPVWFLANRNKKGNGVSYGTVNGQTGKVAVDLPVDFKKYLIGSLIIAVPIFALLTMFATLTPIVLIGIAIALSIVAVVMANVALNKVYTRRGMYDDLGLSSKQGGTRKIQDEIKKKRKNAAKAGGTTSVGSTILSSFFLAPFIIAVFGYLDLIEIGFIAFIAVFVIRLIIAIVNNSKPSGQRKVTFSAPFKEKFKTLWKCFAAVIVGALVLIIAPVNDAFYYGAAIIAILLVAWTVLDIIKCHNIVTTRALPQFGKRGGDEHEY